MTEAACSFCGKGPGEVKRLIAGPGVWICDGCVRASHEILEEVDGPSAPVDKTMNRIVAAQQAALAGDRTGARQQFAALWTELGPDSDPMHRVSVAHYMADAQDDPAEELRWDLWALAAADDDPADEGIRGFLPSLYLNLALDYEKLDRPDEAARELERAEAVVDRLPEGGYGDLIRTGISDLRGRLGAQI